MQPGLRAKSRGLQVFARGQSDSNAHYNGSADRPPQAGPEKRSHTPNTDVYVPTRQEIAEFARLPVPSLSGAGNKAVGSPRKSGQLEVMHRMGSPARYPHTLARGPFEEQPVQMNHHHDLFSGSQLGENFMNSGLTTPVHDPEVPVGRQPQAERDTIGEEEQRVTREHQPRPLTRTASLATTEKQKFSVGADGRLSVVPAVHRYTSSHIKDGFDHNENLYGSKPVSRTHNHLAPVTQGPAKLPMRGIRINRGQPPQSSALSIPQVDFQSQSIDIEDQKWEDKAVIKSSESVVADLDDDFDAFDAFGEQPGTPKPRKQLGLAVRRARDDHRSEKPSCALTGKGKERKKRRQSLDYDDKILSSMTFRDLQDEPFDVVPPLHGISGHESSAAKLAVRLEQFQCQAEREQHHFFATMSMEEWQKSGDWFTDQFCDIMQRLRTARQTKREAIRAFETEAAQREDTIRARTDAIDRKMQKMKQDGQRVVGAKEL